MLAHLLIGMFAPLALVLGAPVTLVLRTLPPSARRRAGRMLHAGITRLVAHPATALVLTVVPLFALYATPLYLTSTEGPTLHHLLHAHFLAAGYLFAWVVAGPDPAPRRPSVPVRLVVLGIAIAAHTTLSQLLYAGVLTPAPDTVADRQAGATLMYYGGDVAELMLAFALLTSWRPWAGRRPPAGRRERPPARRTTVAAAHGAP
jgi:putative membrane protein